MEDALAFLYPFRGFRYNKSIVGNLNQVVTQPYDKTSPSMQEDYYQRSPHNVIRITLNLEKRQDPETKYEDAGSTFRQWLEEEVLIQDPIPAIYPYYQEYPFEGHVRLQKGFISLLDLKNSGEGIVPHEHTLAAPKQDRLRLMRSVEGNEDLIYMLYSDEKLAVNRIMDKAISGQPPEIEVTDEYGAIHRIWAIYDAKTQKQIQNAMSLQRLFIADGHHRFETSVNFMNECEKRNWGHAAVESFDKRMVTCFNSADGLTILPTHRLIRDLPEFDSRAFLSKMKDRFEITKTATPEDLWEKMKTGWRSQENVFGFYPADLKQLHLLRLKKQTDEDPLLINHSEGYRRLDVSILHALILERHLGIDENKLAAQGNVDYVREREVCIRLIDEEKYQAAFFLNPTTVEQMEKIALSGERMPQKSTDFYPKLLTGLVFMRMRIKK
jgi:uncharacterized protein (DUF1015 family)